MSDSSLDFADESGPAAKPTKVLCADVPPDAEHYEEKVAPFPAPVAPRHFLASASAPGRTLPHSLEAEEYLLSCCFIDGAEVIGKCLRARIGIDSFYDPKHGIVFDCLVSLYNRNAKTIDVSVVAEELKTAKQLDQIGGYAFLVQVTSRIPTTAQTEYFIDKVRESALLREVIRSATRAVEDCYGFTGGIDDLFGAIRSNFDRIQIGGRVGSEPQPITAFELPPENDPAALLGRNRYIGRGDGAIIVSSSGMGKSVMCYEWPVLAALGRDFLGIETKRPLRSLLIQAEDADGDIGEVMFSLSHTLKLTPAELAVVGKNVVIVREKVHRGAAFLSQLRVLVAKVKPDLVWLNPLHAFAGCDTQAAKEIGDFLRGGLNGINKDDEFAYMIVHHTPKPMTGKGVVDKKWHEFMYDAAGSAEIVNWARAIITLKPAEKEGDFHLVLAKRGKRAGVRIKAPDSVTGTRFELTTKIPIKHSSEEVRIEGRAEPFRVLHWETRDPESSDSTEAKVKIGRPAKFFFKSYLSTLRRVCPGLEKRVQFGVLARAARGVDGISESQFRNILRQALQDGELIKSDDDKYYLNLPGAGTEAAPEVQELNNAQ